MKKWMLFLAFLMTAALLASGCVSAPQAEAEAPTPVAAAESSPEPTREAAPEPTDEPVPEAAADPANYVPGTRTETTYESQWLGLRYTLAEDQVMSTDEEIAATMQIGAEVLSGDAGTIDLTGLQTVYEMMAVSPATGKNISIIAEIPALKNMTSAQYVQVLQQQLPAMLGSEETPVEIEEPFQTELLGEVYDAVEYRIEVYGMTVYGRYMIRRQGDRFAEIVLTVLDEAEFESLLEGFEPLA